MQLPIAHLQVQFSSPNEDIQTEWARLFAGWPQATTGEPDLVLHLALVDELALPVNQPFFSDRHRYPDQEGVLNVHQAPEDHVLLHFLDGALVQVPLTTPASAGPLRATGTITPNIFTDGRFLDVTYTSLAPLFRRFGYFMVHAFGAAKNGRGILIVGPSGSGKTTTGLCLVLAGWQLLCNDVLLIEAGPQGIVAHPTPDDVTIRPQTFTLLPDLIRYLPEDTPHDQGISLTGNHLTNGRWAEPAAIEAIYLPKIQEGEESEKRPLSRAVCLAQIMGESVDKWDSLSLSSHMSALQALCRQAQPYTLHLGTDLKTLPNLLNLNPIGNL